MSGVVARIEAARAAVAEDGENPQAKEGLKNDLKEVDEKFEALKKKIVATKEGGAVTGEERLREHADLLYGALLSWEGRPGRYQLERITPARFDRAWDLRRKYHDKPDISFVDFTSMVVMLDLGITEVFTGDDHFWQVNLGFQLVP